MAKKKKSRTPNVPTSTTQTTSQKRSSKPVRARKKDRTTMYLLAAGAAIAIAVIALIVLQNRSQAQVSQPPAVSTVITEGLTDRNVKGSADAPVTVTVYSDFECPACKSFATGAEQSLDADYVNNGLVRLEYKHFPLPQHNPSATQGALAAECAADQGQFWPMHDYLFQEAGKAGTSTFTLSRLRSMSDALGLDTAEFSKCVSQSKYAQQVRDDIREGQQLGVNATPTIYVNGQKVDNSYSLIKAKIDEELAKQG
ncbi:MAG: DsbA family protein [Caldilineae bacterium]|nr:DsbA family protein [Anaerolineae bacterium]MCB0255232.1 DsbA family protein [Anaerolineae bacterium]MCB9154643.1 DsbA family protein [Caldilineae bacterium]